MIRDSYYILGLAALLFIANLVMLYNGHDELSFVTAVMFGFWLGSCRWT